jgi:hypothetical protein
MSNEGVWYLDHLDIPWEDFYTSEPLAGISNKDQQKLVLGGEVCMWGETADTSDVQQTIWPRAAAAAGMKGTNHEVCVIIIFSSILSLRTHLLLLSCCRAYVVSIGGHICTRLGNNCLVSTPLFQMLAKSPWNCCSSSHKLLCSEASHRSGFMLCSVNIKYRLHSKNMQEVLCLLTTTTLSRTLYYHLCSCVSFLFVIGNKSQQFLIVYFTLKLR